LPTLKKIYTRFFGQRIFVSFIVMAPLAEDTHVGIRSATLVQEAAGAKARLP